MEKIKKHWSIILIGSIFVGQAIIMYVAGENIYISTHDNMDLHVMNYHLLAEQNLFFSKDGVVPILDGISRDYFFSEWSLYSWLYMILPTCYAYITGYMLKTIIGTLSFVLLAKHLLKEKYEKYRHCLWIVAFTFGMLPLYSTFALYFASIPLVVYILIRICENPDWKWYIALFLYPLVSYFVFFGIFILGYLLVTTVYVSIKKKRIHFPLFGALIVLSLGYITMEYRLFKVMLFSDTVTIRETMKVDNYSLSEVFREIILVFKEGIFHAESCHKYFVLPICLIAFLIINILYFKRKEYRMIIREPFNGVMVFILFNCVIHGFYSYEPFRTFIETLIPQIKGLQLNRTLFFNTFLWYVAFFIILTKLWDLKKSKFVYILAIIALGIVVIYPTRYNDFYNTCFNHFYEFVKQKESNSLSYKEYYSADLIEDIKTDINYNGEKCISYGLNPAVIEYSGIQTIDGCISYYEQSYKEEFRKLIAPALELNSDSREYFDDWGARAYIYSASTEDIYGPYYNYSVEDKNLYIDTEQFRKMGGTYIFSRIEIENATDKEFELVGTYSDKESPYVIYLYRLTDKQ